MPIAGGNGRRLGTHTSSDLLRVTCVRHASLSRQPLRAACAFEPIWLECEASLVHKVAIVRSLFFFEGPCE